MINTHDPNHQTSHRQIVAGLATLMALTFALLGFSCAYAQTNSVDVAICALYDETGLTPRPGFCPELAAVLAIAYTDTNPNDGPGFKGGVDVLIAKLVDQSGDGQPSPGGGDEIITGSYPLNDTATTFGDFTVTTHLTTGCSLSVTNGKIECQVAGGNFVFEDPTNNASFPQDRYVENGNGVTYLIDSHITGLGQEVVANVASPSVPDTPVNFLNSTPGGDDGFIDIDILVP